MLITRKDYYKVIVNITNKNITATMYIEFELNQRNLNSEGEYYFKIKDIINTNTSKPITDPEVKKEIAQSLVDEFYKNSINFIGKTITELSIKV